MERRSLAWLLLLPLTAAGSLLAHGLSYGVVHSETSGLQAAGVHDYLEYAPLFFATSLTLVVVALVAHAVAAFRGRERAGTATWAFALFPPLGFVVQEHLERLIATGHFPTSAVLEPTFLIGLVVQIPFALAAIVLARFLVDVAQRVGRALASLASPVRRGPLATYPTVRAASPPRIRALALGYAERGPPFH